MTEKGNRNLNDLYWAKKSLEILQFPELLWIFHGNKLTSKRANFLPLGIKRVSKIKIKINIKHN